MPVAKTIELEGAPLVDRTWIFTATIGNNWNGFPIFEHRGKDDPLNHTAEIWLTGEVLSDKPTHSPGTWWKYPWPIRISDMPWATPTRLVQFELLGGVGINCCWYTACPEFFNPIPEPNEFEDCDMYGPNGCCPEPTYACPSRGRLWDSYSGPSLPHPVTATGEIQLIDTHFGGASDTWGMLRTISNYAHPGETIEKPTQFLIYFEYNRPGFFVPGGDRPPGTTIDFSITYAGLTFHPTVLIVHHTSADLPGTTPGYVDVADLVKIATGFGKVPCYGLTWEDLETCWLWYADITADGYIDTGDAAMWAHEDPKDPQCAILKSATPEPSTRTVLRWFGMDYSGRDVMVAGKVIPEVVLLDPDQLERGLLDPEGYRSTTTARLEAADWSTVKRLFR